MYFSLNLIILCLVYLEYAGDLIIVANINIGAIETPHLIFLCNLSVGSTYTVTSHMWYITYMVNFQWPKLLTIYPIRIAL